MAFPNAYISTDEPPRRSVVRTALCYAAVVGLGYLGAVILVLSFASSEFNPMTQVASDYGVGAYATEMNAGFFVAGVGTLSLGLVSVLALRWRSSRAGGILLFPGGVALIVNAFYTTDVEGAARTFHGLVHGFGGAIFFFTVPAALLLVNLRLGRRRSLLMLAGFLGVIALFVVISVLSLNASGLGERFLIGVAFSSAILTSLRIVREP